MRVNNKLEILKIVSIYATVGSIWIFFSDSILGWFVHDPQLMTRIAIFKGFTFILCTTLLLYFLISRHNRKIKQSLTALHKSENHLQTLIQTIPDMVWLKDKNGVFLSCNRKFEPFCGIRQEEIIGKTDYDFVGQDNADLFRQQDKRAIESGRSIRSEEWVKLGGHAHQVLLETIKTPMYDQDGELIGVLGIARDITERKQMEEKLRESEDKFRLTFAASPDAISVNRLEDGLYVDVNEGFIQNTGYSHEELIGKTSLELDIWAEPDDRSKLTKELKEKGFYHNLEAKFRKKDGTVITGLMSARIINIKGVPHLINISRDITEHKRYDQEMQKIEKLESLGVLAGGIAHDFNNVLTGIIGNITLAKVHLHHGHKSNQPLIAAEKAAVRAGELAHQLLTFARGGEPVKKVVSPAHLVAEALSLTLHGSNVKGVIDIPDSVHAFEVDEGQMSQVFHNIVINATQAMPAGGTLTVAARNTTLATNNPYALPAGNYIRFTIADQGCGIPKDTISKIFDPYFTTKPTGNGLGLASVYSIVTRHGGHIGVDSEPGEGTTFTIHVPSKGERFQEPDRDLFASGQDRPGGTILVMDDEPVVLDIATAMLHHLGYQVAVCEDGQEAIRLYRNAETSGTPFLAVIMDLTIPGGLGGKEAAESILADFPDAPLIVSSGYSNDSTVSNYRAHGFIGAIAKPYTLEEFSTVLNSLPERKN